MRLGSMKGSVKVRYYTAAWLFLRCFSLRRTAQRRRAFLMRRPLVSSSLKRESPSDCMARGPCAALRPKVPAIHRDQHHREQLLERHHGVQGRGWMIFIEHHRAFQPYQCPGASQRPRRLYAWSLGSFWVPSLAVARSSPALMPSEDHRYGHLSVQ